jgi:hypothetical protein
MPEEKKLAHREPFCHGTRRLSRPPAAPPARAVQPHLP